MKIAAYALLISIAGAPYQPARAENLSDNALAHACNDVVVVGRVKNGEQTPVENTEDILGHSWVTATMKVSKVVVGQNLPKVIPVLYFAHVLMREDRDFMFVLGKNEAGAWEIKTGQLMSTRPHLKPSCD
jgi:hypothetical protein